MIFSYLYNKQMKEDSFLKEYIVLNHIKYINGVSMSESMKKNNDILKMATDIISSYVSYNSVNIEYITPLLGEVYNVLSKAGQKKEESLRLQPAVTIKKSIFPDYIVCLEDGKKLKMLKRHLKSAYGMTPEQYRERWGLPADYPMVAPNYAEKRSSLAREIGLGRKSVKAGRRKKA